MIKPHIRCAIYTRKSSDEGLDQNFNSLDAQAEACAAYIASQRHEGWIASKTRYDDGGLSGGTLDRPALQRLLADIDAGLIRMVVVYKIDRLTRSLADFAKLVERMDAAGCSFVSVTQAFNTASSMGRLTLNVLLSFAQFEREVTAERIRDKIAASKRKGLWMGGMPPIGYDPDPDPKTRSLVINDGEAVTVRTLFALYDELGCLNAVMTRANALGLRSKCRQFRSGRIKGGQSFSRGQVHAILRNPVYVGKIRHKTQVHDGQHAPLIDLELWERVQAKLSAASARPRGRSGRARSAPLLGKLYDETGDRLTPTHTLKDGRPIRYYVSNRLLADGLDPAGWRLPAPALERAVATIMASHVRQFAASHRLLSVADLRANLALGDKVASLAQRLDSGDDDVLNQLLARGYIAPTQITLDLDPTFFSGALLLQPDDLSPDALSIKAPFALRRRGVEGKIVIGDPQPVPDRTLLRALAKAHDWAARLRAGEPIGRIAASSRKTEAFIRTRIQLAFLSPSIQRAILDGQQPTHLTLEQIIRSNMPLDWDAQERLYGFNRARAA